MKLKNDTEENFTSTVRLTLQLLQTLRREGFKYVQVKGFTTDRRLDYMEPRFLVLLPIKVLPEDPAEKEIYEPIESKILEDWAKSPEERMEIFISLK